VDRRAYNADLSVDWQDLPGASPIADGGLSSWTSKFSAPVSSNWASTTPTPYDYTMGSGSGNPLINDFGASFGNYSASFDPMNAYSSRLIGGRIDKYYKDTPSEWQSFEEQLAAGPSGGGGNVSKNPGFASGNFNKDPAVFGEIEAAAAKYGIPANLLKSMIARESTGDWERDGNRTPEVRPGDRILPYVGIFESTAKSWGYDFNAMIGNRALQIDAMANGLRQIYSRPGVGDKYGWDGVIATYYSGNPDQTYTPPDSLVHGTTSMYVSQVNGMWQQEDAWTQANGGVVGSRMGVSLGSPQDPNWQPVNQWDSLVATAASRYGVPPNLVKSIIRLESGGVPTAQHGASGATGLMQIMPDIWNGGNAEQLFDPAYNIDLGTKILKSNYDQHGSWEMAARAYLGLVGADANGTTNEMYWNQINGYWKELDGSTGGGTTGPAGGDVLPLSSIWGNMPGVSVTQGNLEANDWVLNHTSVEYGGRQLSGRGMYDYAYEQFGQLGHPGVDYGMEYGTKIYTPVGGTVIAAGGTGFYGDDNGGIGEIRVRMDNGHELIFGHMGSGTVQVGQRINAGSLVGTSGTAGSGPHLHLEYRVPNPQTPSGWMSADPATLTTGGVLAGGLSSLSGQISGRPMPTSYQDMIIAIMRGDTVQSNNVSSGNAWNDWLVANMFR